MNYTFIALVPEGSKEPKVVSFRPIALYNLIYKVITKILVNRLKPFLERIISPWQSTFFPNRGMSDNIVMAHKVMHYLNKKKGKVGIMALKIDMAKAYDNVQWNLLC